MPASRYQDVLAGNIAFKLPLRFAPAPLASALPRLDVGLWEFKSIYARSAFSHDATWEVLILRGPRRQRPPGRRGTQRNILTEGPFADYGPMKNGARWSRAAAAFPAEQGTIMLLKIRAGGVVTRHTDPIYQYRGRDLVPVHVVITTNPSVAFFVNGQRIVMRAGEVWAINATLPHEIYNSGKADRVHMVLHLVYNEEVAALFKRARAVKDDPRKAPGAAAAHARRYLDSSPFQRPGAVPRPESAARAGRRRAAVVAQLLKTAAGAAR